MATNHQGHVDWAKWLLRREFGVKDWESVDYIELRERAHIRRVIGPDARKLCLMNIILSGGEKEFVKTAMIMFNRIVGRRELRRTYQRKLKKYENK